LAATKIEASNIAAGAVASTGFTSVQVFTAASTWTRPTDITKVIVEVQGGGGSSGSGDVDWSFGGGGGSGGYVKKFINVSSIANAVLLVGAGGIKSAGTSAGNSSWIDTAHGGSSTLTGGLGGNGTNGVHPSPEHGTGGTGGTATGGDINIPGENGTVGNAHNPASLASSELSTGGYGFTRTDNSYGASTPGHNYGGGAAQGRGNNVTNAGSDGAAGIVIVWEYK
jgi:hypothetical protein